MIKIGVSGSREGMTHEQYVTASGLLATLAHPLLGSTSTAIERIELHHGDCKGADEQFNNMGKSMGVFYTIAHPPINATNRAFCQSDVILKPKPYLPRNEDIVNSSDMMITTPKNMVEKGGTWHAIHYARSLNKDVIVILPTGETLNLQG